MIVIKLYSEGGELYKLTEDDCVVLIDDDEEDWRKEATECIDSGVYYNGRVFERMVRTV